MANLGGLPTSTLPAAGEIGGPAAEAVINGETVRLGIMRPSAENPNVAEPFYGALGTATPQAGPVQPQQPDITQTDPVDLANWLGEQETGQLGVFDRQLDQVRAPLQRELDTSYAQYQSDLATIRNAGLDREQQRRQILQLNNRYNKQWIKTKSKLQPQIDAIEQAKVQAQQEIRLNQALRMKQIQTYAELSETGEMDPALAKSLQFKALGYNIPLTSFQQGKVQNPLDRLRANTEIVKNINYALNRYRYDPKSNTLRVEKPRYMWRNPNAKQADPKRDFEDALPRDRQAFIEMRQRREALTAQSHQLAEQHIAGRRVPDLMGAAGPMADGVSRAKPRPRAAVGQRQVTEAQARALLAEAGGDKERAREIARSRGLKF